ncbi:DUF4332 domain-containing protein [Leptospira ilyithenensis]|uniref:DUF4332 domain-containing protein n=1 Tax=Leptospira ilyithenensis TaxID=2484901 RepID=A0A4R9LLI5_9LEPT|nr:DUF4332 domain-containing protein [Leptospira ilyithenensis]TGN07014.1 DUF4332 domain-containing protein [Leptospira ilyithenensis]
MAKLEDIEGIGPKYANILRKAGVRSIGDFLKKTKAPQGRKDLAKSTGILEKLILEWANHVDLFRIKGIGEEYADLLEEAGVDTVVELSKRKPGSLYDTIKAINDKKKLVRQLPSGSKVEDWVLQAKKTPRALTY